MTEVLARITLGIVFVILAGGFGFGAISEIRKPARTGGMAGNAVQGLLVLVFLMAGTLFLLLSLAVCFPVVGR